MTKNFSDTLMARNYTRLYNELVLEETSFRL